MAKRINVIAEKSISLGGHHYGPGDRISMAEPRVRQYELIGARTGSAVVRRATAADDKPTPIPVPRPAREHIPAPLAQPEPPTRQAAVVNPEPLRGRYRNRRLKSED